MEVPVSLGGKEMGESRTLDISEISFAGSAYARFQIGQTIFVEIDGIGIVPAKIVRTAGSRFAARFFEPIDLKLIGLLAGTPEFS
ncbi:hypothetical protein [Parasphingopyxis sp.]|uniref:hypothetical protein n=1 Tax=Parasphingopyxis sp. TaxID=1920299 RepID=UPI0026371721|nr:hypothetical protein [Parasphingopyxis sp.]